jgi:hypothetical protein
VIQQFLLNGVAFEDVIAQEDNLADFVRLPTANTNIPTMMIAEKIGDALLSPRKFP